MPTDQIPYLQCKNAECRRPIWLPRSSQLHRFPDRFESNNQYFEIYLCPSCAHAYDYRRLNVLWSPRQIADRNRPMGLYAALLEFDCGTENCGTRILIRKPTAAAVGSDELVKESGKWVLTDVHCLKGHEVKALPIHHWGTMFASDDPQHKLSCRLRSYNGFDPKLRHNRANWPKVPPQSFGPFSLFLASNTIFKTPPQRLGPFLPFQS